jgi:hypothetical protein
MPTHEGANSSKPRGMKAARQGTELDDSTQARNGTDTQGCPQHQVMIALFSKAERDALLARIRAIRTSMSALSVSPSSPHTASGGTVPSARASALGASNVESCRWVNVRTVFQLLVHAWVARLDWDSNDTRALAAPERRALS